MILATDVHYPETGGANAAGVLFRDWKSDTAFDEVVTIIDEVQPYEPGSFYKRELPCLLKLIDGISTPLQFILVDGFVTLGTDSKPGLGSYLYQALNGETPIIGIAKNRFAGTLKKSEIYRGQSKRPIFVTAAGIDLESACSHIQEMTGPHRIPYMLQRADHLCRQEMRNV